MITKFEENDEILELQYMGRVKIKNNCREKGKETYTR